MRALPRLFCPAALFPDAFLALTDNPAHYLSRVLRRTEGDQIALFNGEDGEWEALIQKVHKKTVTLKILTRLRTPQTYPLTLALLFAPLKPHRLEMLIEKGTELGVTHFVPCQTERTQSRPLNWKRLQSIAVEATEQSTRLSPPLFAPLKPLEAHLSQWASEAPLFWGDIDSPQNSFEQLRTLSVQHPKSVAFLVGPEGGWSPTEQQKLKENARLTPLSLGSTTLRAETAAFLGIGLLNLAIFKN